MFAALAFGAPFGTMLYSLGGFAAVGAATIVLPLVTLLIVAPQKAGAVARGPRGNLWKVAGAVWLPGVGSALSTVGIGWFG